MCTVCMYCICVHVRVQVFLKNLVNVLSLHFTCINQNNVDKFRPQPFISHITVSPCIDNYKVTNNFETNKISLDRKLSWRPLLITNHFNGWTYVLYFFSSKRFPRKRWGILDGWTKPSLRKIKLALKQQS